MQTCTVEWEGEKYEVEYSVSFNAESVLVIDWKNSFLDAEIERLQTTDDVDALTSLHVSITNQVGEHWKRHSGDDWQRGRSP